MIELFRRYKHFLIWFVFPAYLLILNNSIFNQHIHILPNGLIISHAHPFKKNADHSDPAKSHTHTKTEFFVYNKLALEFFDDSFHIERIDFTPVLIQEIVTFYNILNTGYYYFSNSSRAPPLKVI